jgi:Tfp pilus assembly protein PilE
LKKAFTLIEVMIAVMVFFVAVLAFMSITSNSKRIFHIILQNQDFDLKSSVVFVEQKDRKNLYEELLDFNITNDHIISKLKQISIKFDKEIDTTQDYNITKLIIYKLIAYNKYHSSRAYEIELGK